MAIPHILENAMIPDTVIEQLKPRFGSTHEWADFLAFIEDRKVRGDVDEVWLQWDIHRLMLLAGRQSWQRHDHRFLPETIRLPETPLL